jgi:ABC-type transport system involved in multi-copper enzyme maturation permease subunit
MSHSLFFTPLLAALPLWLDTLVVAGACAAAAVALLVAVYFGLKLVAPRVAAIARTGAKEAQTQPLFWCEIALGSLALLLFALIPYNTFGDDLKVMKDSGLTLITVLGILLAVWSASVSIADELEGRTALTLLSKPVTRRQFILGKFLGVLSPVYVMFVVLGTVFLLCIAFRVSFESIELSRRAASVEQCRYEMLQIVPGLVLAFFEAMVLSSISVAISTRLPMIPNLVICAAIYALGHLGPLFVQSSMGRLPVVTFIGQFLATILPVLDHFNIQAAIAAGREVPLEYLAWAFGYAVLYSTIAMLLALVLFEDRDLA